jgi:hypothetical protein
MIVRETDTEFVLIPQPDHAQLAEAIIRPIQTEPSLAGAAREAILLATREHDNGWTEVDASPTIDVATGRPCDFMHGPTAVKHELWIRGVTRVAKENAHAGALVAEHAITVYGYRRHDAEWNGFFASLTALRDALLQRIGMFAGRAREQFEHNYRCVQLGDSLSLHFCHAWTDPQTTLEYTANMDGNTLVITPDPFAGSVVSLRVIGRRIPARSYRSDADLRTALAAARPELLAGEARGVG